MTSKETWIILDEELDLKMKDFKELDGRAVGKPLAVGCLRQCSLKFQQKRELKETGESIILKKTMYCSKIGQKLCVFCMF